MIGGDERKRGAMKREAFELKFGVEIDVIEMKHGKDSGVSASAR